MPGCTIHCAPGIVVTTSQAIRMSVAALAMMPSPHPRIVCPPSDACRIDEAIATAP